MPDWWPKDNLIGTLIACLALLISLFNTYRTQVLARRQARMSLEKDRKDWADKVLDSFVALDQLFHKGLDSNELRNQLSKCASEFSGLADKGKLRFPNDLSSGYGKDKVAAYQGIRKSVLDEIIFTHNMILMSLKNDDDYLLKTLDRAVVVQRKRAFISEVQTLTRVRHDLDWSGMK